VLGLLGPNGAGKTTAVRVLTTLLRPDAGRVEVAGVDVLADPAAVRSRIGLTGQSAAVDENLTGRENLVLVGRLCGFTKTDARTRAGELLDRFDLSDAGDRQAKTYSGGMRRRLDLAAALIDEPEVLFLDEPTTGLDPRSRNDLWSVIEQLVAGGSTLLLTTQYLEEADRLADRIAVVDHGRIIAEGTPAELKATLGATVVEIGQPDAARTVRAAAALAPLGTVDVEPDATRLQLTVDDGPAAMVQIVRLLDGLELPPTTLALREPSLDDVFLSLTGQGAPAGSSSTGVGA
jgi:ABC-2 type transport system ATP-binding protein